MLDRLKARFYWKNFVELEEKYKENGLFDGFTPSYSEVFSARANISANKGTAETEMFGNLLEYDRTIVARGDEIDMDENSIVWLDGAIPPDPHNYIVVRKSVSGNYTVFALKRVEVGK